MDSVRLGRALGVGARAAAKTLVSVVDAAASPNPSAGAKHAGAKKSAASGTTAAAGERLGQQTARAASQMAGTGAGLKRGGKRFGQAVWRPFVKLSGVLWLELTGVFFGIFALSAVGGAWRMRAAMHETAGNHLAHERFEWAVVMAVVFAYFCVTSFLKAQRRGRGQ